jgi:hypothetical protein
VRQQTYFLIHNPKPSHFFFLFPEMTPAFKIFAKAVVAFVTIFSIVSSSVGGCDTPDVDSGTQLSVFAVAAIATTTAAVNPNGVETDQLLARVPPLAEVSNVHTDSEIPQTDTTDREWNWSVVADRTLGISGCAILALLCLYWVLHIAHSCRVTFREDRDRSNVYRLLEALYENRVRDGPPATEDEKLIHQRLLALTQVEARYEGRGIGFVERIFDGTDFYQSHAWRMYVDAGGVDASHFYFKPIPVKLLRN